MAKKPVKSEVKTAASGGSKAEGKASASALPQVALYIGEDAFLRQELTNQLRASLEKAHGEVEVFTFDGESCQASQVLDECRSFGLMATHKLVILDNADDLIKESTRSLFERYAESPSEQATLVIRSRTWRAGKLDKMIEAVGTIRKCEAPNEKDAAGWVLKRAAHHHKATISLEAAQALVARVGPSLMNLDSELGKLAAAAGSDKSGNAQPITIELIAEFVGVSREEEAWGVQQTLLTGNTEAAIAHLRHVLDVSRQPTQVVMYAMTDLSRKLHGVCAGLRGGANAFQLSKPLRLWGPSQEAIINSAKRMMPSESLTLFTSAVEADRRSKTGFTDSDRALEVLAVKMTGAVSGQK